MLPFPCKQGNKQGNRRICADVPSSITPISHRKRSTYGTQWAQGKRNKTGNNSGVSGDRISLYWGLNTESPPGLFKLPCRESHRERPLLHRSLFNLVFAYFVERLSGVRLGHSEASRSLTWVEWHEKLRSRQSNPGRCQFTEMGLFGQFGPSSRRDAISP